MKGNSDTDARNWDVGGLWQTVALVVLLPVLGSCAGPQSLRVAIDPQDEVAYLQFANDANLNGRLAFANWMSQERGLSPEEVLGLDGGISPTRNPYDAYHDAQAVSRGAVIYKIHCLRCHGDDARGRGPAALPDYPANDFKTFGSRFAATLHRGAPRKWFRVIRDGAGEVVEYPDEKTTAMPSFSQTLAREQIWLVITYLQSLDVYAGRNATERRR
ncbi:MAG: c-type cytochrome [bacterium]|nr:c-type cytochrome [bacterium]